MASPVVTGSVALVRQYFEDGFYPNGKKDESESFSPSAALIKAMADKTWKVYRIRGKLVIRMQFKYTTFALICNDFVINLFSTERFGSGSIPVSPYHNHVGYGRVNLLDSLPLHSFNNFRVHVMDRTEIYNHEEHFIHLYVDTGECSWDHVSVAIEESSNLHRNT